MPALNRFVVGEVYFHVTYSHRDQLYPGVQTLVFLGKNLSTEDSEDTWYFQSAEDYGLNGSALTLEATEPAVCFTERDVEDVFDMPGLLVALEAAAAKRVALRNK